jgi:surface protein
MKKNVIMFLAIFSFATSDLISQNFFLAPNGVTCMCPDAEIGESGVINGITYTKRDRYQITWANASTTCTSGITDMSNLFAHDQSFNETISSWDVSNVTDMNKMFNSNKAFNQNINDWDVSNVTDMSQMFANSNFNQPLNNWDVSNVTNMREMFANSNFNQPISNWNVSSVTHTLGMFFGSIFNQPLSNWDVSNVTNMAGMFSNSYFNQPLSNWDVSNVTNMAKMFSNSSFNQPLSNWDVSNVTNMSYMFANSNFNQPLSSWGVSNVTNMSYMFSNSNFNQQLSNWNVSSVTNMSYMFSNSNFNQQLSNWNVSSVTNMSRMFHFAQSFNQDLRDWVFNPFVALDFFIAATSLNIEYYDALLQSFNNQNLQNKQFTADGLTYCDGLTREDLMLNKGWIITGDNTIESSITAPEDISVTANEGTCEATNVDLGIPYTQSCLNFTVSNNAPETFPLGHTTITWILTDDSEATYTSIQHVTVTTSNGETSFPTSITAPENIFIITDPLSCEATNVELGSPFTQSCLNFTVTNNAPQAFPLGETQVTWTITDDAGVTDSSAQIVTVNMDVDIASICYVTSDEVDFSKNRVFIGQNGNNVEYYEVLRETSSNIFTPIGTISPGETSFLDATSNNTAQTYRYSVRTIDICQNTSANAPLHTTMLLQSNVAANNSVNLNWTSYQGAAFGNFEIYRRINDEEFELIASLPASNTSFNDTQANILQNNYEYYIAIEIQPCASKNASVQIRSNREAVNNQVGIKRDILQDQVIIYPNPSQAKVYLQAPEWLMIKEVRLFSLEGQLIYTVKQQNVLNIENLKPGMYLIQIITEYGIITKPITKQ